MKYEIIPRKSGMRYKSKIVEGKTSLKDEIDRLLEHGFTGISIRVKSDIEVI